MDPRSLLKVDIEGHEDMLFGDDCSWLEQIDALCIEWHVANGPARLTDLARRFGFAAPRLLPSNLWLLTRPGCAA